MSDGAESVEEEVSTSTKVDSEAASSGATFFTPPQLSTLAYLTTFPTVIPAFGQRHAPVLMTPLAEANVPRTMTEMVPQIAIDVAPRTVTEILPTAVAEVIPVVPADITVAVSPRAQLPPPEPELQVRLEVTDCDAVVTVSSSFLAEAESAQPVPEENMELVQSGQPEVMDRASEFLRQQFRLTPAKRGPSIQSPMRSRTSPTVPKSQLQEEGMPHAVFEPTAEKAAPDVGMAPADEENSDAEWSLEDFVKEDYGSDEDKCRDYLRTMKSALKKGHDVAIQALTRRRECHLIRAYIRGICLRRFQTCFVDRG